MTFNLSLPQELPLTTRRMFSVLWRCLNTICANQAHHSRPQRLSGIGCV
ncbi:hypothetical protein BANRA_05571 [Klebsiella pneumoniae]|nr:hypothetical protein BANRA_05571 [Klebsiella pneumoniae]